MTDNIARALALEAQKVSADVPDLSEKVSEIKTELDNKQPKGNYLTEESDPTVPSWAKEDNKPTYTAEEVGALPDTTVIPTIDSTLSESGQAADSKTVGDRFDKLESASMTSAQVIDALFRLPRTGKVYTVQIPKFEVNQSTTCTKTDDNAGLVCKPSTDTVVGQDDYADIPLFKWYNCNYLRSDDGHAYPTAIEGIDDGFVKTGNVDVGVIQMTPYIKYDDTATDYDVLSITDTPREGYVPWVTARNGDEVYPYVIHSKYFSGIASDGLLRSIYDVKPARNQSHNNMITNYGKKGAGYTGAGIERNTWQIVFTLIKYAEKSSQNVFAGTTNYSFQYEAAVQRTDKLTYFPVTKAQAANVIVGSSVSVGYGIISNSAISNGRGNATIHKYADNVKVLKIESIDDTTSAVYLDITEGFDTTPVVLSEDLSAPIVMSSMFWYSGSTDSVVGHHDGSLMSNTNHKYPYRVQGVEYSVGLYTVASDTVFVFDDTNGKDVYVCPRGVAHSSTDSVILSTYQKVGNIPAADFWIGDIGLDVNTCATWAKIKGSGAAVGVGDYLYGGGNVTKNTTRECLQTGSLGDGAAAGSSFAACWYWLGNETWDCGAAD